MAQVIPLERLSDNVSPYTAIIRVEGLGDVIASEPVIGYAKASHPGHKIAWVTRSAYASLLSAHPGLDYVAVADSRVHATEWAKGVSTPNDVINLHFHRARCLVTGRWVENGNKPSIDHGNYYDYVSLLASFVESAGLPAMDIGPRLFLPKETRFPDVLPKPYVAIHCESSDAVKDWDPAEWAKLLPFLTAQGFHVAEFGLRRVMPPTADQRYHDMTGRRPLCDVAAAIRDADFFIGVDSGLAHMANALHVDGLVIMGQFGRWEDTVPFSGFYSRGHIVRVCGAIAYFLPVEAVKERFSQVWAADMACDYTLPSPLGKEPEALSHGLMARLCCMVMRQGQRLTLRLCRVFLRHQADDILFLDVKIQKMLVRRYLRKGRHLCYAVMCRIIYFLGCGVARPASPQTKCQ